MLGQRFVVLENASDDCSPVADALEAIDRSDKFDLTVAGVRERYGKRAWRKVKGLGLHYPLTGGDRVTLSTAEATDSKDLQAHPS